MLFQLLVDHYATGTGSYQSCQKFYTNYLSLAEKETHTISCLYDTLKQLKTSKENYTIANNYYDKQAYIKSYRYYHLIIQADHEHYQKALRKKQQIEMSLVRQIDRLTSEAKLQEAYALINTMYEHMDMPINLDVKLRRYFDSNQMNADIIEH